MKKKLFLPISLTLAVLYMNAGGRGRNTKKGAIINVNGYDFKSQKIVQSMIQRNYDIQLSLHKNGQLYMPVKS